MVKDKDDFKKIKCRKTGKTSLHCFGEISILLSGNHLENTFSRWYLRIIFNKFTGSYKIYRTYKNTKEEAMIKVVVANVLYLNILNIMTTIFSISSAMAKEVFTIDAPDLKVEDMDIGSALFYQLFGLLFILAAIVCSFLMLWTVYSRYIKLYLLMILAPFAMSALVGGQEIERSFYAWMRTFLLNAFEIVVIALTMVISFKLIGAGISLFDGKNIATSMVDGFWDALNSLFTMILVTAAVKGSNAFLSKAMGL